MTQRLIDMLNIGGICAKCDKPHAQCTCSKNPVARSKSPVRPAGAGIVRVGRETKGRRGKGVTTIAGLPLDPDGFRDLAAKLKNRCGSGGTVKEDRIEIQGDHRDTVVAELEKLGYKVKRTGG
ncbi:translation initiation factor SUI1 [Planctomycetaceae bacterium SCGC AG-212-F19]|nr:translation initiation factor SUI1 [Planctomycetaceae bacterium SCGC AG-212-F19]